MTLVGSFVLFGPLIGPGLHVRYPIPIAHLKALLNFSPHHVWTTLDKHQHVVCEGAPFPGGFAIDLFPCIVELILIEDLSERSGCGGRGTGFDPTRQRRCWNPGDCHDTQTESTYDGSSDILHWRLRVCSFICGGTQIPPRSSLSILRQFLLEIIFEFSPGLFENAIVQGAP